jgi:hypothetical protein
VKDERKSKGFGAGLTDNFINVSPNKVTTQIEEIAEKFYIPPEIESALRNALTIKLEIENSFNESEKDKMTYQRIIKPLDLHVSGLIKKCAKK